jgi:hypothetical protein
VKRGRRICVLGTKWGRWEGKGTLCRGDGKQPGIHVNSLRGEEGVNGQGMNGHLRVIHTSRTEFQFNGSSFNEVNRRICYVGVEWTFGLKEEVRKEGMK